MTKEERGVIEIIAAVAQAIKELSSVPSGHLYARLMGHMSLETYERIITVLVNQKLVTRKNHVLFWIGE